MKLASVTPQCLSPLPRPALADSRPLPGWFTLLYYLFLLILWQMMLLNLLG